MNRNQLKTFVLLANIGKFSETAKVTNYSVSSIYVQMDALEKELDTKLYEKTSSGIQLTEKGREFLFYAQKMLSIQSEMLSAMKKNSKRRLVIMATETIHKCIMDDFFIEYLNNAACDYEIEYTKNRGDVIVSRLMSRTCDVGLICATDTVNLNVQSTHLVDIPFVFVCSPKLAEAKLQKPRLLAALNYPTVYETFDYLNMDFYSRFSSIYSIGDFDMIVKMLAAGTDAAFLPKPFVKKMLENGSLIQYPELKFEISQDCSIAIPCNHEIGPEIQRLIDCCFEKYNPAREKGIVMG